MIYMLPDSQRRYHLLRSGLVPHLCRQFIDQPHLCRGDCAEDVAVALSIATELSWDKVGVGSIETMFEHMVHSFTDDDPPYDLICTDEVMLRRFAVDGRVMPMNDRMRRDGRLRRRRGHSGRRASTRFQPLTAARHEISGDLLISLHARALR